jgi:hypothetical protein
MAGAKASRKKRNDQNHSCLVHSIFPQLKLLAGGARHRLRSIGRRELAVTRRTDLHRVIQRACSCLSTASMRWYRFAHACFGGIVSPLDTSISIGRKDFALC